MTVPVAVLSTTDPVLRDTAAFNVLVAGPGTAVLRQDLDRASRTLRRTISDITGVVDDVVVPLEHACWGCAIREDSLPTLGRMAGSGRWERILFALPVAADCMPITAALAHPVVAGEHGLRLASAASVVELPTLRRDLFDDDPLAVRDLALSDDDGRCFGEAVAGQLRHAGLVLTVGADEVGHALVEHVRGATTTRLDLYEAGLEHLFPTVRTRPRITARPDLQGLSDQVWTLELVSTRPLHPERLLAGIEGMALPDVIGRGRFHLASRPHTLCEWDGVGGQLSIAAAGRWPGGGRSTRLVFTGVGDPEVRAALLQAFSACVCTDHEMSTGAVRPWIDDDGFDPWLGTRHQAA
ncbi:GTP-binding protein [Nakamurella alba]|uniref:GTP-binding protein n=1 Tax=Nakamurella alba TaxID=2665158 RepID=UPI002AC343BA|nr:GTP-binding protein [Nakamurella alba]